MSRNDPAGAAAPRVNKLYFAAWRWHFYAAVLVVPFLIMLTVTGAIMMIYTGTGNQLGQAARVSATGPALPVSQLLATAVDAVPDSVADQYVAPEAADRAAYVVVKQDKAAIAVAVDPFTGAVLNVQDKNKTLYAIANDIHGSLLIGDIGDFLIEAAASLTILMVVTGLYLWWPRERGLRAMFVPRLAARGRSLWKELHGAVGTWVSVALLLFCLSGLAWAGIWGGKFVQPWGSFPIAKKAEQWSSDVTHASMSHGVTGDVPWALEQTPMPISTGQQMGQQSGDHAGHDHGGTASPVAVVAPALPGAATPVTVDTVADWAAANGFAGQYKLTLPKGDTGVFTVAAEGRNEDGVNPNADRTVHLDRYNGAVLADIGYADYGLIAKAMAWGIGLHKGLAGTWNFILNLVLLAMILMTCVSGIVMWWKRRPTGAARLAAPPVPVDVPMAKGVVLIALALSLAFPVLGLTLLAVLALDLLIVSRIPALKRALS